MINISRYYSFIQRAVTKNPNLSPHISSLMQDLHSLSFPFLRSSTVTSAREYLTYENLIHFKLPRRVYLIRRLIPDSGAMCTEKIARVESGSFTAIY